MDGVCMCCFIGGVGGTHRRADLGWYYDASLGSEAWVGGTDGAFVSRLNGRRASLSFTEWALAPPAMLRAALLHACLCVCCVPLPLRRAP